MPDTAVLTPQPTAVKRPPGFSCFRSCTESSVRVTVAGELDIATVPELDRALRRAEADAALVVLDLRALDFIDSSGAHLLRAADRRIQRGGGHLVVVRGSATVHWILELLGIDGQLTLVGQPPERTRTATALEGAPA